MIIPRQALSFKNCEWLKLDENAFAMMIPTVAASLMNCEWQDDRVRVDNVW